MRNSRVFVSLFTLCAAFCACSDDDDPKVDHAINVVGTYAGTAALKVAGQEVGTIDACTIVVTRVSEDSVALRMDNVQYGEMLITNVTARAVVAPDANNAGSYSVAGSARASGTFYSEVVFTGTISAQRANLEITVTVVDMPAPVVVSFEGSQGRGTVTVNASDYTKWVYFSFERGQVVAVTDPRDDLSWDIALHRYDLKTNGGASGTGQGAALKTEYKKFNDVATIPAAGYEVDVTADINLSGMPPVYTEDSKNEVLGTWVTMDLSTMPPPTVLSKVVYIVRTAAGKHVKVLFTDNTNDEGVTGHVTFSYEIQP
ncbi:MAG: hypothetical protein LBK12_09190 [Odoribacteraceae bacterium]|jgi:hypothetical protein|nr:hypothetical protein [Odoribacteraceae bacterium]